MTFTSKALTRAETFMIADALISQAKHFENLIADPSKWVPDQTRLVWLEAAKDRRTLAAEIVDGDKGAMGADSEVAA